MNESSKPLGRMRAALAAAALRHDRDPAGVHLLAVSKQQPVAAMRALHAEGQLAFGENYVQEALPKQAALADLGLEWHFIGRIQRNKTRDIATHFDWVHTVDRLEVAERLGRQRPSDRPPLQCFIEVNVSGEASKGGVAVADLAALVLAVRAVPGLQLRGLMCLPAPARDFSLQRAGFRALREARDALADPDVRLLSMGTSTDFEAAIAEGTDFVRIGTLLFGPRR